MVFTYNLYDFKWAVTYMHILYWTINQNTRVKLFPRSVYEHAQKKYTGTHVQQLQYCIDATALMSL